MQKKCRKCGTKFTVKTSEDYCPECMEVMTPPPAGTELEVRECEGCGEPFEYFRKPQGRPRKYCPDCAIKFCHKSKKDVEEEGKMTTVDSKKTEERHIEDSSKEAVQVPHFLHFFCMILYSLYNSLRYLMASSSASCPTSLRSKAFITCSSIVPFVTR